MKTPASVSDVLEQYVPPFDDDGGDWDAIVRRGTIEPRRRGFPAGVALLVAAVALTVLLSPVAGDRPGVLERALAAIGDGPVLHVVLEDDWAVTLVDLRTGERRELHGEREFWYDPARGLHEISRLGDAVQADLLYRPDEVPRYRLKTFALLGEEYREALLSGRARNLGAGTAYGEPVYWLRVDAESLPDSADDQLHEWAHDVAVSRTTFEPVATRETRDGVPGPATGARILRLETLAEGEGDFDAAENGDPTGTTFREGREPAALSDAAQALGRTPVWLGREYASLPLSHVFRTTRAEGRMRRTEVTGSLAREMKACGAAIRRGAERTTSTACARMRRSGLSLSTRGGAVYQLGPVVWGKAHTGVVLRYGPLGAAYVELTETTHAALSGPLRYAPPEGTVLVTGARVVTTVAGVYVSVVASTQELALAAARALVPMPPR